VSVNKVILVGNLGADPESRTTQSGSTVCNIRLATTSRRKDKDGNYQNQTEWHRVVCFGKTAENAQRFLRKGKRVYVEGELRTTSYEKDGVKKYSTEVVCNDLRFLGSKGDSESSSTGGGYDQPEGEDPIPF
jgi:single-strand DNA-binding protein